MSDMTNAQLENALRNDFLTFIGEKMAEYYGTDSLRVSASELAIPTIDADGNERWILAKISVPRGTRNGEGGYIPYDGYAVAESYAIDCQEKAEKKADIEARKQAKIEKDRKKREEKKALAEANRNLKELRKIKLTPAKE